jgi:hypothetical protein
LVADEHLQEVHMGQAVLLGTPQRGVQLLPRQRDAQPGKILE